jgi:protein-tyrosine phosphatase
MSDLPEFEYNQVADRLYAGRNPITAADVDTLAALGVNHYLDLREAKEYAAPRLGQEALAAMSDRGIIRTQIPITDTRPPSTEDFEKAVECLERALSNPGSIVYVSCRAGRERTAAILVAYQAIHSGRGYEKALEALQRGRPSLRPLWGQEQAVRRFLSSRGHQPDEL